MVKEDKKNGSCASGLRRRRPDAGVPDLFA